MQAFKSRNIKPISTNNYPNQIPLHPNTHKLIPYFQSFKNPSTFYKTNTL